MKSIIYVLITIFTVNIFTSAVFNPSLNIEKQYTIHCVDKIVNLNKLYQSAQIIHNRLSDYGLNNFQLTVSEPKATIQIMLKETVNTPIINELLTSTGKLEFYETFNRNDLINNLSTNDTLFSLLNIPSNLKEENLIEPVLGYCYEKEIANVNKYINHSIVKITDKKVQFIWSKFPNEKKEYSLCLLSEFSSLSGKHVKSSSVNHSEYPELKIEFDNKGKETWQKLTKRNVGKAIAIVLDKKVYFSPMVMSEIKSGSCTVTGNFTYQEMKYLAALINNGMLPLDFKFVE